eukprot:TRINITY_DN7034_c0_g3_i1.p3 TRINITY_DN7034_c0_g3~~TRINITY_DN7034_c0_g3_i1.p3  ORF type:complete len:103 (+),score=17.16 TRINITY_DN7034_c0_g3_i1:525-833(+)
MKLLSTARASLLDIFRNESKVSVGVASCVEESMVSAGVASCLAKVLESSVGLVASPDFDTRLRAEHDRFTLTGSQEVDSVGVALNCNMLYRALDPFESLFCE